MSWKTATPMQLSLGNLWSRAETDWKEDEAGLLDPAEKELCGQMEGTEAGTRGLHSQPSGSWHRACLEMGP